MRDKPDQPKENPYKLLYWMGAGVVLLLLGVGALAFYMKPTRVAPPDPERTLLWLYEGPGATSPASLVVVEESRSQGGVIVVPVAAPAGVRAAFAGQGSRRAAEQMAGQLGRKLQHRVFLPSGVVSRLVDAAGGIDVAGRHFGGDAARSFLKDGGDDSPLRAAQVMLALADAVAVRGVSMTVREGLALAQEVETDLDLTALPLTMGRWRTNITLHQTQPDPAAAGKLLRADPPAEGAGQ